MQKTRVLVVSLVLAGWNAAHAAPFVAVNASANPGTIVPFDTSGPGDAGSAVATLGGTFIRGLDLTGALDGYYVATASSNGSETGLFRLEDGISTRIGEMPFETTAVGGLTLNAAGDGLYAALNAPASWSTLYAVSFTGEFTPIGPIRIGQGSTEIAGLALDPADGTLYALDNQSDHLLRVDAATGEATPIGTGLGINAIAAGGMDFALDGSGLFITTNNGRIHPVDAATGAAGPLLGSLPFASGSIAAVPEPASLILLGLAALRLRRL